MPISPFNMARIAAGLPAYDEVTGGLIAQPGALPPDFVGPTPSGYNVGSGMFTDGGLNMNNPIWGGATQFGGTGLQAGPVIGAVVGGALTTAAQQALCALFPSMCGNATDQTQAIMEQGPAPKAGLLTGACPPGRVIRHMPYARDICAKKPRMNVLNPSALRRAARRLGGFHAFAVKAEKELNKIVRKGGFRGTTTRRAGCTNCGKSKRACACG